MQLQGKTVHAAWFLGEKNYVQQQENNPTENIPKDQQRNRLNRSIL